MNETTLKIQRISPHLKSAVALMDQLNQHHLGLVDPSACHLTTPEDLDKVDSLMVGAFKGEELCAIGAVKFFPEYGEITRMYTQSQYRGQGIAKTILDELLRQIQKRDLQWAMLETSDKFKSAVKLYLEQGFQICEPFGEYIHKKRNTYMRKKLDLL